ncbi:MAG: cytochrome c [Polyangiaceae bacterium]
MIRSIPSIVAFGAVVVAASALAGCRGGESEDPPILLLRNMYHQERYNAESYSSYFEDHRTMRTPPEGTVDREHFLDNESVATGRTEDGSGYVMDIPESVAKHFGGREGMVDRGHERFNIYCAPCHDQSGRGNGMVVQKGFQKPPMLHDERLRKAPDGQIFATITNGVRVMPSYAAQIPVHDRWAIVSYVRALEMSQISMTEPSK